MYKRILFWGSFLLLFSWLFFAAAFYFHIRRTDPAESGRPLFTLSSDTIIDRIEITDKNYSLTLLKENESWRVAEADFYYANARRLEKLLSLIEHATYSECISEGQREAEKTDFAPELIIKTYAQNTKINDYVFGGFDIYNQRRMFKTADDPNICLTETRFDFPRQFYSWLQQPLLQVAAADVAEIQSNNVHGHKKVFLRAGPGRPLLDDSGRKIELRNFFDIVGLLTFTNTLSVQNIDEKLFQKIGTLKLTMFSGLIYNLTLYQKEKEFWMTLTLSSTVLPTAGTGDYIKNSAFLYDGWYFRLQPSKGRILAETAGL